MSSDDVPESDKVFARNFSSRFISDTSTRASAFVFILGKCWRFDLGHIIQHA